MKKILPGLAFLAVAAIVASSLAQPATGPAAPTTRPANPAPDYNSLYKLGADSLPHDGVPRGKIVGPVSLPSTVFPGTSHSFWVYVPAQYDPAKPAALMIFQDGHAFMGANGEYRIPNVFDNLIYRREMPVTIAVFINPGHTPEQPEPSDANWGDGTASNRPTEYNELNDKYAKVITDELMPALAKDYNISKNPDDRALAGASSGAIAAFTVAWQRPDQFHKVISIIGSFTNIRGGDAYPDLIRAADPKPIRIFFEDGLNDNRGAGQGGAYDPRRDWHLQNMKMVDALTAKKYDVNFEWGLGTHSNVHGGAIMPEMLRWLWRDYARPDDADRAGRMVLTPSK